MSDGTGAQAAQTAQLAQAGQGTGAQLAAQNVGQFAPTAAQNSAQAWMPQGQQAGLQPSSTQSLLAARESPAITEQTPWYNSLVHGGGDGKMTSDEARQRGVLLSQYNQEADPAIKAQLRDQMDSISSGAQDRGGILGSIGRAVTGKGIGGGENLATAGLSVGLPILKALYAKSQADQLTGKMLANQNQVRQNQQAFMRQGLS